MLARQRKPRLRMIETLAVNCSALPLRGRVATRAVSSKPSLMLVLMARAARR